MTYSYLLLWDNHQKFIVNGMDTDGGSLLNAYVATAILFPILAIGYFILRGIWDWVTKSKK